MRVAGSSSLIDWIALTVRWLMLIGAALWLAYLNNLDVYFGVLIIAAILWNLAATILVAANHASTPFPQICVVGDFIFAHLIFYLGFSNTNLIWVGLLPLATAALYFRWIGAASILILNTLIQTWLYSPGHTMVEIGVFVAISLPMYALVGFMSAYGSQKLASGAIAPFRKGKLHLSAGLEKKDRERRRTIFDLISALSASLNYQRVLETSLDLTAETLGELDAPEVDKLVSAVLLFNDVNQKSPELRMATARNVLPSDRDVCLPGVSGLLAHAIDEGEPSLSRNLSGDAELNQLASLRSCHSAYCLPLRTGLDAYGILLFAHPDADFFTPDRREVLDIIAKQSVIAIQNARLYQDLEQEKNRMAEIQEESRKKLARDLHDGPTQSISAIAMRVNFARRLMERDPRAAAEELYKIEELARRTTKEIRHMLFTLRPLVLESQGLVAALESMADKMRETFNQNVIIHADPRVIDVLEAGKQAIVFYIAEEAVNNARKHAQAEHIWVRLKMLRDGLSLLEVEDDGTGFDVNSVGNSYESRGSLGMINLRERTELVNGVLRIDSAPGRGTRVQVVIPLTEEAADRIHRAT
jgi:signal transduction histidine kinase